MLHYRFFNCLSPVPDTLVFIKYSSVRFLSVASFARPASVTRVELRTSFSSVVKELISFIPTSVTAVSLRLNCFNPLRAFSSLRRRVRKIPNALEGHLFDQFFWVPD